MRPLLPVLFCAGFLAAVWASLSADERIRLQQLASRALQPAPAAPLPSTPPPAAVAAAPLPWPEHAPERACVPRSVPQATPATATGVYRWRDAQGRWHYGDKAPTAAAAEDLSDRFVPGVVPVTLLVEADPQAMPPAMRQALQDDAVRILRFYARYLPQAATRRITVRIRAFSDADAFAAWRAARDSPSSGTVGLYDALSREVAVLLSGDAAWDAGVIRHEIVHAIHYELLARPPLWFDEGMAGFFQALQYRQGAWQPTPLLQQHLAQVATLRGEDLLAEFGRLQWPGPDPAADYARAWALAAFLWSGAESAVFGQYVQWLADNYCQVVDTQAFLQQHYPGGLPRWQQDWAQWLQQQREGSPLSRWWQHLPVD